MHHPMAISQETLLSKQDKADKIQLKFITLSTENIFLSVYVVLDVLVVGIETVRGNLYLRLCFHNPLHPHIILV